MSEPYGLPPGTAINYGVPWPNPWVDELCRQWQLDSSTYPGHQEGDRPDIGCAPNPAGLNRGIDWAGDPQRMLDFAHWLVSIGPSRTPGQYGPEGLEMVIYEHAPTGERVWYPDWVNYDADFSGHRDHVHTRQSASLTYIGPPLSKRDQYASAIIQEGRKRNISPRGIMIALTVPPVESGWKMYANSNVPESLNYDHEAVGSDHDSTGLFQQRQAWGPLSCTMDAACSAGLFFDGGQSGQRGLTAFDYDNPARSPGFYAQAVQVSAYPDRYDQRWDEAVALYNRLSGIVVSPPEEEEDWMANPELERLLREVHAALFNRITSQSPYRHLEGEQGRWQLHELIKNDDKLIHQLYIENEARKGDPEVIALLYEVASADPVRYPDRQHDAALARKVLESLTVVSPPQQPPVVSPPNQPPPIQPPVPLPTSQGLSQTVAAMARALEEAVSKADTQIHQILRGSE